MKCFGIAVAMIGGLTMAGQQVTVTKSLSNIKNNIEVSRGTDGKVQCLTADKKPCSPEQVKQLNQAAAFNSSKSGIKTVALANGSLQCDGKPCTAAQVTALNAAVQTAKPAESKLKP